MLPTAVLVDSTRLRKQRSTFEPSQDNNVTVGNRKGARVPGERAFQLNLNRQYRTNSTVKVIDGLAYDVYLGSTWLKANMCTTD